LLRFLIIEDDEAIRTILRTLIKRKFECEVLEAENGKVAIELMLKSIPDLILSDISMPVMDGLETLKNIRSNAMLKNIPVMIITAHSDKKTFESIAEIGITDYLVKPIDKIVAESRIQKFVIKFEESKRNKSNDINKAADLIIAEQLLIVDNDSEFISYFSSLLNSRFIIHSASSGVAGLNVFSEYYPSYIFVSDNLSLLDKKILSQKIKDIAPDKKILIYLLRDEIKELSTKVFTYDGIIKKSFVPDQFLKEFDEKLAVARQ